MATPPSPREPNGPKAPAPHADDSRRGLTLRVKAIARGLGFDPVGVTSAEPFIDTERVIVERVRAGLMDGLPWYHADRARRGCHPHTIMPEARSIISLALDYRTPDPPEPADGLPRGRVSRYAWGRDYHHVIEGRVKRLLRELQAMGAGRGKFYVDYGPMPDRAIAARAGVGWHGKNSNLLTAGHGSWVFLAEVLTDLDLEPDAPLKKSCGRCAACIPACPTGAIVAPYVIDNRLCISYHTIENRGPIPRDLRPLMGDWVFGCDVCQDVCPVNPPSIEGRGQGLGFNSRARSQGDPEFAATSVESSRPDLVVLLSLTDTEFDARYRGSPVRRATRVGLQRNACVALGNLGDRRAVPALIRALREGAPLVRSHAAWALGRLGGGEAAEALATALAMDQDAEVREEVTLALAESLEKNE